MKTILKSLLVLLLVAGFDFQSKAQSYELEIDSLIGIPDQVVNGDTVSFYMIVSLNSPLFYSGDVFVEIEYGGNFYEIDEITLTNPNGVLSPSSPNYIQAQHRFSTDDDLSIGDNVVVVWPRIGDGITPPQTVVNPYTTIVTLVEPNSIQDVPSREFKSVLYPNPAKNIVRIKLENSERLLNASVYDLSGKLMTQINNLQQFDVSGFAPGLYFVDVVLENGTVYSDKLLITY